jgi:PTH1 family peptidyl-tRNA hydrolase
VKLIVGLGNPGVLYAWSRHNIGFQVVKSLARSGKIALKKEKGIKAFSGRGKLEGVEVVLSLPLTFMNLSGQAVKQLLDKYNVELHDLLVVCDDLDLEFGRIKIRSKGSSAGHRGINSIIGSIGNDEFNRLRIGIGRPSGKVNPADFVLSHFNRSERKEIPGLINKALDCCRVWLSEGIEKSMNNFNRND